MDHGSCALSMATCYLREQELELKTEAPLGAAIWTLHVVEGLQGRADRKLTETEDLADAATDRDSPPVAAVVGLPVGRDDGPAGVASSFLIYSERATRTPRCARTNE